MGTYFESSELFLLALALSIGVLSAYTFFYMISQVQMGMRWHAALSTAALFVLGFGVMQLLIQLASDSLIGLDWTLVLSYLLAVGVVKASLMIGYRTQALFMRWLTTGLLLTLAHLILHYGQILSFSHRGFTLHPGMAISAFLIHLAGTILACYAYHRSKGFSLLPSAILMGCSAMIMQMINTEALTVEYGKIMTADLLTDQLRVLAGGMGVGTLLILSVCLMVILVRRRLGQVDEQYRLLVENSLDMIAIVQQDKWIYMNRSGLRLLEAGHAGEVLGTEVWPLLHKRHHQEMIMQMGKGNAGGSGTPLEQEWFTLGGKTLHTEVTANATLAGGRPATQLIVRDISERKKNEELLINSEKLYVAGQLAAGIAHEIRNPLTSLKGFLQLISTGRSDQTRYYDIMKSELTRIESIVSELLMLSKPQLVELNYCDARQIVQDTVALLEPQANLYNIILDAEYSESPLWVRCVENQIKQVLINILKNAIEVMPGGGSIRISAMLSESQVKIRIEDEGPGLDEEQLAKVGQPFYTTKNRGTGLGLMVSFKIIDNHKGKIAISSELGVGTTCIIKLPYAQECALMATAFQPDREKNAD
ncbi:ATP-binding protein [Paenibacillus daejeonensis]|uniref:ATP-binding protein n=1 Tax=Paenibacillus daejeonensis TaxID=135193 RepID=UPI00037DBCAD|nr:ATP-binding protein [Paenibacillus daejeonensis]